MHTCLWDNKDGLTESCRREELKLKILQSRDIRLRPKLNKLCSGEITGFCKDVKPGAHPPPSLVTCPSPLHHFNRRSMVSIPCWICSLVDRSMCSRVALMWCGVFKLSSDLHACKSCRW